MCWDDVNLFLQINRSTFSRWLDGASANERRTIWQTYLLWREKSRFQQRPTKRVLHNRCRTRRFSTQVVNLNLVTHMETKLKKKREKKVQMKCVCVKMVKRRWVIHLYTFSVDVWCQIRPIYFLHTPKFTAKFPNNGCRTRRETNKQTIDTPKWREREREEKSSISARPDLWQTLMLMIFFLLHMFHSGEFCSKWKKKLMVCFWHIKT